LSYGNEFHKNKVIEEGKKHFGNNFIPLMDFMEYTAYIELLKKVDIAVFNHNRQQAMGNILTLLGLGKKVYIKKGIATWTVVNEKNLVVKEIDEANGLGELETLLTEEEILQNKKNVLENFSLEMCVKAWKDVFK